MFTISESLALQNSSYGCFLALYLDTYVQSKVLDNFARLKLTIIEFKIDHK